MLLQHKAKLTKKNAIAAVDALFETISNIEGRENPVNWVWNIEVRERAARTIPLNYIVQK
jgi:hypothetical protein